MAEGAAAAVVPARADGGAQDQFLAQYGAQITDVALVLPRDLAFEDYSKVVGTLGRIASAVPFYIGDAMLHGEAVYGEPYAQVMNDTGLAYQTLANYVNVARWVEPDVRRADLSHGHHAAVAQMHKDRKGIKVPDKDRQRYWLQRAAEKEWSRSELREAIAADSKAGSGTDRENTDPASELGPADQQPRTAEGTAGGGAVQVGGTTSYDDERTKALLMALRDAYDSAVPVSALADARGYYAVPEDVVAELAQALGEDFTPQPYDNGDYRPPVVEGTASPAAAYTGDDDVPMGVVPPQQQGAVPHVDPPQPPRQTRGGVPVLDPSQVRIEGAPLAPGAPVGHPAGPAPGEPPLPPATGGETFEGFS